MNKLELEALLEELDLLSQTLETLFGGMTRLPVFTRASQKSSSELKDPIEGFVRMRDKTTNLTSNLGNLMKIHE